MEKILKRGQNGVREVSRNAERQKGPDYVEIGTWVMAIATVVTVGCIYGHEIPSLAHSAFNQVASVLEVIGDGGKGVWAYIHHDVGLKPGADFVGLAQTKGMGDLIKTLYSLVPDGNAVSRFTNDLLLPIK